MDYRTAIHEAAQFVVRYRLDPTSNQFQVSIVPDDESFEAYAGESPRGSYQAIESEAISLIAGFCAELKLLGNDSEVNTRFRSGCELDRAKQCIAWIDGDLDDATAKCHACVDRHWSEITRLADELLVGKLILGDEAELICDVAAGVADISELIMYRIIVHRKC